MTDAWYAPFAAEIDTTIEANLSGELFPIIQRIVQAAEAAALDRAAKECFKMLTAPADPTPEWYLNPVDAIHALVSHTALSDFAARVRKEALEEAAQGRPKIVCLCGSTRFYEAFMQANYDETMQGNIVLSVGFFMHRPDTAHGQSVGCTPEQKVALDALHKKKIDLADEVLVLNVSGYIGESTRSEIEHAKKTGKPVRYLEPLAASPARTEETK